MTKRAQDAAPALGIKCYASIHRRRRSENHQPDLNHATLQMLPMATHRLGAVMMVQATSSSASSTTFYLTLGMVLGSPMSFGQYTPL